MADSILDAMTEQYNSLTRSEKSWQIIFYPIQRKLSICLLVPLQKIQVCQKLPLRVSAV